MQMMMEMGEPNLIAKFSNANVSDFPDFNLFKNPLERGLWVLWIAKEKLNIKKMTAEQIASVILDVKEVSIDAKSINYSFAPAKGKVHIYHENGTVYFEIMKTGKDHLLSLVKQGSVEVLYFQPDQKFSTKRTLSKNILEGLQGKLQIVDPYCSERTLDVLKDLKDREVDFLTRVENLREKERERFLRELQDFKSEFPTIKFRNYPNADIHDRYIISENSLVILGHSVKDLGSKESFAIILDNDSNRNVAEALTENFNRRWKQAAIL
jgi:hypothetical protein